MGGILLLILVAIGVFLSPDLRSNPVAVGLAILCFLGVAGLIYGRWRAWQAEQGMMDQRRR